MIHFAGGEPFLYYKNMLETAKHGKQCGFSISVVTNGFWAYSEDNARKQISNLVDAGLIRTKLSFDSFHNKYIPVETIRKAIRILKEFDVSIVLRIITTKKHKVDETLRRLSLDDLDSIEISSSPIVPVGRARMSVNEDEYYLSKNGSIGYCADFLNLTITDSGNVAVCCAGSELSSSLWLGNVNKTPLNLIVRDAEWNMLIKKLVHQGPSSFFAFLNEAGLGYKIKPSYTNICHACSELFNDDEVVKVIKNKILDIQSRHLTNSLKDVEA